MRTPTQVRTTAFIAYALAIVAALLVSFVVHALFGSQGRGGFLDLNFGGILEIAGDIEGEIARALGRKTEKKKGINPFTGKDL